MSDRAFAWLCVALFVVPVVVGVWAYTDWRTCLHSHVERRFHGAWVQYIQAGKVSVPIIHPAHWADEEVCDTWEEP